MINLTEYFDNIIDAIHTIFRRLISLIIIINIKDYERGIPSLYMNNYNFILNYISEKIKVKLYLAIIFYLMKNYL